MHSSPSPCLDQAAHRTVRGRVTLPLSDCSNRIFWFWADCLPTGSYPETGFWGAGNEVLCALSASGK
jgi:hypothetical protein